VHEFEIAERMADSAAPGAVLACALLEGDSDDSIVGERGVSDAPYVYWLVEGPAAVSLEVAGPHRLCVGPPVEVGDRDELAESVRLVRRLHELADAGLVADEPVLECADHEVALWLHAEPALHARLAARVLAGIEAESPYRRRTLATTLLAWLEGARSANALARELEVHPQTVRYRLRQLRAIFGDALDDRDRCFELLIALRIQLPRWLA